MSVPDKALVEKAERYAARHGYSSIRLSCSTRPPRLVVSLSGALDTGSSTDFLEFLNAAKATASADGGLSIDMAGISYVSSTGIGVLSTAMIEYTKEHIRFSLRCVPEKTRSLFQMLGLWEYFSIDPDVPGLDS